MHEVMLAAVDLLLEGADGRAVGRLLRAALKVEADPELEPVPKVVRGNSQEGGDVDVLAQLRELVQIAGSGAAAARLLGLKPNTLYRWSSGRSAPSPPMKKVIFDAIEKARS